MREWEIERVARASGAEVVGGSRAAQTGPEQVSIDSRAAGPGRLFVGLKGERVDGGVYARQALEAGAWGVLVKPEHVRSIVAEGPGGGVVLAHPDPLQGLQRLAEAWLEELRAQGARVVGVTGSTGKTSTKDILAALLEGAGRRTVASPENRNTEIGLPLTILEAPKGTQALVLEMAMRGRGQIAELTRIARPDVGVIVNVGPVHVEQLGTVEGVLEAKAELIEGLSPGATAVVPADEPRLERYRREGVRTVTFGPGGDVQLRERKRDGGVVIDDGGKEIELRPSFEQAHNLQRNLLAAVAAVSALGVTPGGEVRVRFSRMRGQRKELPEGVVVIEDCYNANPMSMRAAIDDLLNARETRARTHTRAVAVLGDMLELGKDEQRYHREIGEYARERGVDVLVTVGERAKEMAGPFAGAAGAAVYSVRDAQAAGELLKDVLANEDTVLVKASRAVGLERVIEALAGAKPVAAGG